MNLQVTQIQVTQAYKSEATIGIKISTFFVENRLCDDKTDLINTCIVPIDEERLSHMKYPLQD